MNPTGLTPAKGSTEPRDGRFRRASGRYPLPALAALMACLMACLMGGCGDRPAAPGSGTNTGSGAEAVPPAAAVIGTWGVDLEARDISVLPGDDFFRHANGGWLARFELPPDKTGYGAFYQLYEQAQERVRGLIEEMAEAEAPQGSDERRVGDYYASFLDVDTLNRLGLAPLGAELERIAGIDSAADLAVAFARSDLDASASPFQLMIEIDRMDPSRHIVGLGPGGLGLPDRDYYLGADDRFASVRTAYEAHIAELLTLAGWDGAEDDAAAVVELEGRIAALHPSRADRRNRDLTYNLMSLEELAATAPGFDWQTFFEASGFVPAELNVRQPDAMAPIVELVAETPLDIWRAYLTYHLISSNAPFLSEDIDAANFAFYGPVLYGQPEQRPRWRRAISLVGSSNGLGDVIGRKYVARYFPPSAKAQVEALVENLRAALDERLDGLDWMGDATRIEAKNKLERFLPKIGYPDRWRDYSAVEVRADDLMGNVRRLRAFYNDEAIARLSRPTDRTEWVLPPQTVNAFYQPQLNTITFPAGILEAPFFDPAADPAVNYGAIGAVIGHELGHGFDDQGSKSDGDGLQRDWWAPQDRARFEALAAGLVDQYSAYEPLPGAFVDGEFTLGENIGDLGGLNIAYHAYRRSLGGVPAPVLDGLSGDQRFFLAFAQVWRSKQRDETTLAQLTSDPHAPTEFRTNGAVRNMDAWYEAFDVKPGQALYLPPEARINIW